VNHNVAIYIVATVSLWVCHKW